MRHLWSLALFLGFALGLALAPTPGAGEATSRVEVHGGEIRLRDLAGAIAGLSSKGFDLERVLLSGLQPGEERVLTAVELSALLAAHLGQKRLSQLTLPATISLRRSARVLAAAEIVAAGEEAIREHMRATEAPALHKDDEVIVSPVMMPRSYLAPVGPVSLEAAVEPPKLAGGLWVARVTGREENSQASAKQPEGGSADTGWRMECTVRYRVRVAGPVLVTRRMVRRHEVLGESDVAVEVRELTGLRGQPLRTREELSGRRASRPAPAGSIVAADWMEPAPEVRRGELVTVVARVGGIWASTQATALAEGRTGDTIAVRKLAAAGAPRIESEFLARVCGPGRAEVVLSP